MNIIYKDNFLETTFDQVDNIFYNRWNSNTMKEDDFKNAMFEVAKLALENNPIAIIINSQKFSLTITPMLQEWYDETIVPQHLEAGVKYMAFVFNEDLVTQLSIEQTMEEQQAMEAQDTRFFDNEADALIWLKTKF